MPQEFAKLVEKKAKKIRNAINAAQTKAMCLEIGRAQFDGLPPEQAEALAKWLESAGGRWLIANGQADAVTQEDLAEMEEPPEWAALALAAGDMLVEISLEDETRVGVAHVADWVKANPPRQLGKLSFAQAIDNTFAEDRRRERARAEAPDEDPNGIEETMALPDGSRWVRVLSAQSLNREGALMRHCVGSYAEQVAQGKTTIYSLRNPDGAPRLTVEAKPAAERDLFAAGMSEAEVKAAMAEGQAPALAFIQVRAAANATADAEALRAARGLARELERQGQRVVSVERRAPENMFFVKGEVWPIFLDELGADAVDGSEAPREIKIEALVATPEALAKLPAGASVETLTINDAPAGSKLPAGLKIARLIVGEKVEGLDAREAEVAEVTLSNPWSMEGAQLLFGQLDEIESPTPNWREGEKDCGLWREGEGIARIEATAATVSLPWMKAKIARFDGVKKLVAPGARVGELSARAAEGQDDATAEVSGSRAEKIELAGFKEENTRGLPPQDASGAETQAMAEDLSTPEGVEAARKTVQGWRPRPIAQTDRLAELFEAYSLGDLTLDLARAEKAALRTVADKGGASDEGKKARADAAALGFLRLAAEAARASGFAQTLAMGPEEEGQPFSHGEPTGIVAVGHLQTVSGAGFAQAVGLLERGENLHEPLAAALDAAQRLRAGESLTEAQSEAFDVFAPAATWAELKNPENDADKAVRATNAAQKTSRKFLALCHPEAAMHIHREGKHDWMETRKKVQFSPPEAMGTDPVAAAMRLAMTLKALGASDAAIEEAAALTPQIAPELGDIRFDFRWALEKEGSADGAKKTEALRRLVESRFELFTGATVAEGAALVQEAARDLMASVGARWEASPESAPSGALGAWAREAAAQALALSRLSGPSQASVGSAEEALALINAPMVRGERLREAVRVIAQSVAAPITAGFALTSEGPAADGEAGAREAAKAAWALLGAATMDAAVTKEGRASLVIDTVSVELVRAIAKLPEPARAKAAGQALDFAEGATLEKALAAIDAPSDKDAIDSPGHRLMRTNVRLKTAIKIEWMQAAQKAPSGERMTADSRSEMTSAISGMTYYGRTAARHGH
jgi:hypothetical protein